MKEFMEIILKPIGVIHSAFHQLEGMPIQPTSSASSPGVIEVYPEFVEGIKDLDGFSHLYLIYFFHKTGQAKLLVTPFLDKEPHGVFATRAPSRPNPIGLSLVEVSRIEPPIIHVSQIDVLDGTPLLDIKPYIPEFEPLSHVRIGWLEQARQRIHMQISDKRFNR